MSEMNEGAAYIAAEEIRTLADDLRDAREGLQPGSLARVGLDIAESRLRKLLTAPPATTTTASEDR